MTRHQRAIDAARTTAKMGSKQPPSIWRMKMTKQRRWMTSVQKEAARIKLDMPWTRGARRAAFIAKRSDTPPRRAAQG